MIVRLTQRRLVSAGMLAAGFMTACGTKTPTTTADAGCVGHGCPTSTVTVPLGDGGDGMRLNLIHRTASQGGGDFVVAQSFYIKTQVPDAMPSLGPALCTNVYGGENWPTGTPTSQVDYDIGPMITATDTGTHTIVLTKHLNAATSPEYGVPHSILYISDTPIDPGMVIPGKAYSIIVPGSADFMAHTFNSTDPAPSHVRIPNNFDWITPPFGDFTIPAGDMTYKWTVDPNDTMLFGFGQFADPNGKVQFICVGLNTGMMTIPAAVIAQLTPTGSFQGGIASHQPTPYLGRRVDMFGIHCRKATYTKQ